MKSCVDQIFAAKIVAEESIEWHKLLIIELKL